MMQQSFIYLQTYLRRLDVLLRLAVQYARSAGFDPNNEFQGLYIADQEVDRHLTLTPGVGLWGNATLVIDEESQQQLDQIDAELEQIEENSHRSGSPLQLLQLVEVLNLSPVDLDMLVISLAPELDRRYERIYGFLQDDVTKRRPTVNLMLNLLGRDWEQRNQLLSRLTSEAPLLRYAVLSAIADPADPHTTFVNYQLKVDLRVVQYIQGIESLSPVVQRVESDDIHLLFDAAEQEMLYRQYPDITPIFYVYGNYGSGERTVAKTLAEGESLELNLSGLSQEPDGGARKVTLAFREGRLRRAVMLLTNWDSILDENNDPPRWLWNHVLDHPHIVILSGKEGWEPRGTQRQRPILRLPLEIPEFQHRRAYWNHYLGDMGLNPDELAYKFKLTSGQIRDAVYTAFDLALGRGDMAPTLSDLYAASRAQSNRKLSGLAVKISPRYGWDHIVLPDDRVRQLREICDQIKYAVQVYERWGFQGRSAGAQGLTSLFAGQSGTGKTMAAEIIARELGLELFKIDLSSVVSKYIGETEKNLATIFDEASQSNAILFFDEADALFGKRSEVKDSHDRYANIEIGYLLQRMESYDGIAILATNLRQNLDEAFTRRLDFLVDFPFPEEEDRMKIWRISFPSDAPLGPEVDLQELAGRYRMAGGNIRNATLAAAFLAAADDSSTIDMRHILHAIRREHQKMGKLLEDDLEKSFRFR